MPLFSTDSIALCYSDLTAAKSWWMRLFGCKDAKVPADWDCSLPSDVALQLPGYDVPTILLSDWNEVRNAGFERSNDHSIFFCRNLTKARENLQREGAVPGPMQQSGGTEFFEIHDVEGNIIEICREP
jgi:hypothetical protein